MALEHRVPLRSPQLKERPEIIQLLLQRMKQDGWQIDDDLLREGALDDWSGRVDGYSVADLVSAVHRAGTLADTELGETMLGEAITTTTSGPTRPIQRRPRVGLRQLELACEGFVPAAMSTQTFLSSSTTLADIGGLEGPKRDLVDMLTMPTKYAILLDRAPVRTTKGMMLVGPPGCGKTMLVQAAANETKGLLRFLCVKGPELLSKYIGESEAGVRRVFERAAAAAPSVVFFDELEALAPKRGADSTGVTDRVVNQMLCYLDGVEDRGRVFVVAATGRPDMVDPALMRPGRFDRICYCGLPSDEERLQICNILATKHGLIAPPGGDSELRSALEELVARMPRLFTSADVNALFASAKIEAVNAALSGSEHGVTKSLRAPAVCISHLHTALSTAKASVSAADVRRYDRIFEPYRPGPKRSPSQRSGAGGESESKTEVGSRVALA